MITPLLWWASHNNTLILQPLSLILSSQQFPLPLWTWGSCFEVAWVILFPFLFLNLSSCFVAVPPTANEGKWDESAYCPKHLKQVGGLKFRGLAEGRCLGGYLGKMGEIPNKGCLLTPPTRSSSFVKPNHKKKVLGQPERTFMVSIKLFVKCSHQHTQISLINHV